MSSLPVELLETPPLDPERAIEGRSPWQLAWARLRRDRVAIAVPRRDLPDHDHRAGRPAVRVPHRPWAE